MIMETLFCSMVFKGWTKNMMDIYLKWRNDKFYFLKNQQYLKFINI